MGTIDNPSVWCVAVFAWLCSELLNALRDAIMRMLRKVFDMTKIQTIVMKGICATIEGLGVLVGRSHEYGGHVLVRSICAQD